MTNHHPHAPADPKLAARRRLRPERKLPAAPLPAGPRAEKPLPDPSDWTFELIESYHEKIDLVFIRHHTQAQEVDEENFFRARETGGTVVSSALVLMDEIIKERYSPSDWNIYAAQASDGDNWHHDSGRCRELLTDSLLPKCRYFAYVQVADEEQNLWEEYARLQEVQKHFAMRKVTQASQIYPVFRDLFKAEGVAA